MKRLLFLTSFVLLACMLACQSEISIVPGGDPVKTMVVNAGEPGTRTSVQIDGGNYRVNWSAGDQIAVAEIIEANFNIQDGPSPYQQVTSNPLAADAASASFTVSLTDRSSAEANPTGGPFTYVGVYPSNSLYSVSWTGHNRAEWEEKWGDTTAPDHSTLLVELPTYQSPTADSFDPYADLLVSQMVTSATQPSELSLHFARVGTIVKVTLTGLPAGMSVGMGQFKFPMTWTGAYVVEYDPVLQRTGVFGKSSGQITFTPQEVTVNGDGEAVIWLRTLSGKLDDWFGFDIILTDGKDTKGGGEEQKFEKHVDLKALGKTLVFPESGMTTFSVAMEKHYDLVMEMVSYEAGETSLTMNMYYDLGGKPHTTAKYGLIRFAPGTPDPLQTVSIASAAPEDIIYLEPDGEGKVTHTETGLNPDTDYCFLPFILVDGTEYHPEYSYLTMHTLKHYDYEEPELVDLGLPSGTKWASFNLGSVAPTVPGYYFAWGEVRPPEYFTTSYSSKYWYQWRYDYPGYAYKYSTCAAYGLDGLVDMKTVLDPEDDAATVCLGGDWRTPTVDDFGELFENCDRSIVDGNYVYTSKNNGASITFPACGNYIGNTKNTSSTYMMTASLFVTPTALCNMAICSNVASGMSEYSDGATRGHMKYNIRPVKGGTRAEYKWTAHTSVTVLGGGKATVHGEFLEAEDLATYQDYTYSTHLSADPTYYPGKTISRNEGYTYTDLTPGTTYYYYVTWDCRRQVGVDWYHHGGESEVRSFVAQ